MEMLDVYDKNGFKTGKVIERGNKNLAADEFIKLAVIWIKCEDKYLLQKTSLKKDGKYAATGGHVPAGSNSRDQISIEVKEELGLDLCDGKIQILGTLKKDNGLFDVYLYEDNALKNFNFVLQKSEVAAVEWLTKRQIEDLIKKDMLRKSSQLHFEKFIK